jgi:hypothetical protein
LWIHRYYFDYGLADPKKLLFQVEKLTAGLILSLNKTFIKLNLICNGDRTFSGLTRHRLVMFWTLESVLVEVVIVPLSNDLSMFSSSVHRGSNRIFIAQL